MMTNKSTIFKTGKDWNAGYFDENGINQYVIHETTKDKLIHKLIELYLKEKHGIKVNKT